LVAKGWWGGVEVGVAVMFEEGRLGFSGVGVMTGWCVKVGRSGGSSETWFYKRMGSWVNWLGSDAYFGWVVRYHGEVIGGLVGDKELECCGRVDQLESVVYSGWVVRFHGEAMGGWLVIKNWWVGGRWDQGEG